MKLLISLDMDNAAFEDYPEIELHAILNTIPSKFLKIRARSALESSAKLYDVNGNAVGTIVLKKDEEG